MVKKDNKKNVKKNTKKENKVLTKIKNVLLKIRDVLNNPKPIIICLGIICLLFIYAFLNYSKKYNIYVGSINSEDIKIKLIQIDLNPKINTIFSTSASYSAEDKKVYQYDIGFYYESKGELVDVSSIANQLSNPISLSELIQTGSYLNVVEYADQESFFTKNFKNNIKNLRFIVKASTTSDKEDEPDIVYDIPVEFINLNA